MTAILFDLDGVIYEGDRAIPGAAEAVEWFVGQGIPHLFLTNTTSKPRNALVEKLAAFGIHTSIEDYLTPPAATINHLQQTSAERVALFIPEVTRTEFSDYVIIDDGSSPVDAVIIGDLAAGWRFDVLNRAFRLLMDNPEAAFIALGMTRYWRSETGLQLDAGPFVKALEYATGRQAMVMGKPSADYFQSAMALLRSDSCVMIGDDIRGDIAAAQEAGMEAVLVKTGKFQPVDLDGDVRPDHVIGSVTELPELWSKWTDR